MKTTPSILETARGPIEAAVSGRGPAVVVVHGTPGNWKQPSAIARDLEDRYTVVRPSRPGYGRTPAASGRHIEDQAMLYLAALDVLGIERFAIMGISGGGPSALATARQAPDRVSGLIQGCAGALGALPPRRGFDLGARLVSVPGVPAVIDSVNRRRMRRSLASDAAFSAYLERRLSAVELSRVAEAPGLRADLLEAWRAYLEEPTGGGVANDIASWRVALQSPIDASPVAPPMLILHGDADATVPLSHAEFHASLQPTARVEVIAGAGHMVLLTFREETAAIIGDFLAGLSWGD